MVQCWILSYPVKMLIVVFCTCHTTAFHNSWNLDVVIGTKAVTLWAVTNPLVWNLYVLWAATSVPSPEWSLWFYVLVLLPMLALVITIPLCIWGMWDRWTANGIRRSLFCVYAPSYFACYHGQVIMGSYFLSVLNLFFVAVLDYVWEVPYCQQMKRWNWTELCTQRQFLRVYVYKYCRSFRKESI